MIRWILSELERNPAAVFTRRDLESGFPTDFEAARVAKLLQYVPPGDEEASVQGPNGRRLAVVRMPDQYVAVDEDDSEYDPIPLSREDLSRYRPSMTELGEIIRADNALHGSPSQLHQRLLYLGEAGTAEYTVTFVMGLFLRKREAMDLLRMLPALLPQKTGRTAVVCPTFTLANPKHLRELEHLGVVLTTFAQNASLYIDMSPLGARPGASLLTPEQQTVAEGLGLRVWSHVTVAQDSTHKGRALVTVGDQTATVSLVPLRLLVRLLLGAREAPGGWVPEKALWADTGNEASGIRQALGRLRDRFPDVLADGLTPTDLVETKDKRTRLSVPPELVEYDREWLIGHHDGVVADLAKKLP